MRELAVVDSRRRVLEQHEVAHLIMHKLNKAKQLAWLGLALLLFQPQRN